MMKFIYDSLDTVKGIKHPTKKQYINLTIAIFIMVILSWVYFIFADSVFSAVYNLFYSMMG